MPRPIEHSETVIACMQRKQILALFQLKKLKKGDIHQKRNKGYICPIFDYCDVAWCGLSTTISNKLEICQRKLLKMLFCLPRDFSSAQLYILARVCPLSIRRSLHSNMLIQKIKLEKVPRHLFPYDWFVRSRSTRAQVSLPAARTVQFTKSPLFHSYSDWLKLSSLAHHCHSMSQFRQVVCTELRFPAALTRV